MHKSAQPRRAVKPDPIAVAKLQLDPVLDILKANTEPAFLCPFLDHGSL